MAERFPTISSRAGPGTSRRVMRILRARGHCSAGRRGAGSRRCARTPGAGNWPIHRDIGSSLSRYLGIGSRHLLARAMARPGVGRVSSNCNLPALSMTRMAQTRGRGCRRNSALFVMRQGPLSAEARSSGSVLSRGVERHRHALDAAVGRGARGASGRSRPGVHSLPFVGLRHRGSPRKGINKVVSKHHVSSDTSNRGEFGMFRAVPSVAY